MKLLVHTCCAVCLAGAAGELRKRKIAFTAFFDNPNVHPLIEWRKRLKATRVLCDRLKLPLDVNETYGLETFLAATEAKRVAPARCEVCYRMRLTRTAERAKALGFDAFSTTLLASPEQDLALIRRVAGEAAALAGVRFEDFDLGGAHEAGEEFAKKYNIYRQQYCGCIFSEYDRYKDTRDEVWRLED
jgi:epoxyqueuosine reductase